MKRTATILMALAITASFSFADSHMLNGGGVSIETSGGSWTFAGGRLVQADGDAPLAGAMANVGLSGMAEYAFDLSYVGGGEDNAGAVGVIVSGFAMGLVWDPANLGGSGLHAQVYNANAELEQSLEIPVSAISGITADMVVSAMLPVRIRVDSATGKISVKDPRDDTTWWSFSLGQALESNTIGLGTSSLAVSFGSFGASSL